MSDIMLMGFGAIAILGFMQAKGKNPLFFADNSGSIDQATDRNSLYSIGNSDPNQPGAGPWFRKETNIPPAPTPHHEPLWGEPAMHPSSSSRLVTNFGIIN